MEFKFQSLSKEKRDKLYKEILKSLSPLLKKHGKGTVRWALSRWIATEGKKNTLLKSKALVEKELRDLEI